MKMGGQVAVLIAREAELYSCLGGDTCCQQGNVIDGWESEPDGWLGVSKTVGLVVRDVGGSGAIGMGGR